MNKVRTALQAWRLKRLSASEARNVARRDRDAAAEAIHKDTSLSPADRHARAKMVFEAYDTLYPAPRPWHARINRGWWIAIGCVLTAYTIYWLGGAASYNYTHRCVRSYLVDPGTPPDAYGGGEGAVIRCAWTMDNGRRWGIFAPVRSLVHHPASMDGNDGSDGG